MSVVHEGHVIIIAGWNAVKVDVQSSERCGNCRTSEGSRKRSRWCQWGSEMNEQMNETDHAWRRGGFRQQTISQSRYRNMGCRPEVPFSTEQDLLHHFAIASRLEVPGYQSRLEKGWRGSTGLASGSDDDLSLTGGDRPGSEQNGDEEGENGNGERGEGLHCWGARERGWATVGGWENGDKLRKSARKTASAPV